MNPIKVFVALLFPVFLLPFCYQNKPNNSTGPTLEWLSSNANEIYSINPESNPEGLEALALIVGNATLVCLGESRHDIHEQHLIKHKMLRFMVEELGYRSFILEASFPYGQTINTYLKDGTGDLSENISSMPAWFIWDTEEMSALIKWMRAYNLNHENQEKLQFYGIDIVAPNLAIDQVFKYLELYDKNLLLELQALELRRDLYVDDFWPSTRDNFSTLDRIESKTLQNNYRLLYNAIVNHKLELEYASSVFEYQKIQQLCYNTLQACKMFTAETILEMGLTRDRAMANNVQWVLDQNPERKHVLWAHNVHIAKTKFKMTGEDQSIEGMGKILSDQLGEKMISVGAAFNKGYYNHQDRRFPAARANTLEATLANIGKSNYYIDLRTSKTNAVVSQWLAQEHMIRGQDFEMFCNPSQAFDALFFVQDITKVSMNSTALERLAALQ